jgi:F-type H+-transporting ATPase subunit b
MVLLNAAPARAENPSGEHNGHGKEASHSAEPPIFTPVRIDLGIWTLVVFLLLLFVLSKWAWGPMLEGLKRREENIRSAQEEAQRAREEAQRMREQFQAEINQANEKVRGMMDEARRDAQRASDEMLAKAKAEIQTERDRLHREIDLARDQALQQIWTQAAQLATQVSSKAIRRQLTPEDHRRLVDEALAELGQAKGTDGASV